MSSLPIFLFFSRLSFCQMVPLVVQRNIVVVKAAVIMEGSVGLCWAKILEEFL